jgi:electron transfer flavoprotein alpha subunit
MSNDTFVLVEQRNGVVSDISFEMLGKAAEIAAGRGSVIAVLTGHNLAGLDSQLGAAQELLVVDDAQLAEFTPTAYADAIAPVLRMREAGLVLAAASSDGLDLAPLLSARLGLPVVSSCRNFFFADGVLHAISQLYGGKMFVESAVRGGAAILSILPGAFQPAAAAGTPASIISITPADVTPRERFRAWIAPPPGDVDVTAVPVLVSVGRGIQNKENIEAAEELAALLGGAVAASRPVVDQGWLPLTRQIGRSGMIVKPKLYLALGISGAPEHIEGMRDSELIIAVNSDRSAPIFSVAHYGVVADVMDTIPALTEALASRAS